MKPVVIYQSKYGAARRYAQMLAQKLNCSAVEVKGLVLQELQPFDTVVLCGGIYAGGIAGCSFLRKNAAQLASKKMAVFAVGASPADEKSMAELRKNNWKDGLEKVPLFYGRGAWDESKMSVTDRMMCKVLQKMVSKKPLEDCEPWERELISAFGKKCDWVEERYLHPLLDFLGERAV